MSRHSALFPKNPETEQQNRRNYGTQKSGSYAGMSSIGVSYAGVPYVGVSYAGNPYTWIACIRRSHFGKAHAGNPYCRS